MLKNSTFYVYFMPKPLFEKNSILHQQKLTNLPLTLLPAFLIHNGL